MKVLASVLACLCVVLAVACVSLLTTRPSAAASAPDKPAADDKPAAPQIGRYQRGADGRLLDTATGRLWKNEFERKWTVEVDPPKEN